LATAPPDCAAAQLQTTVRTNDSTYYEGDTVTVTVSVTNNGPTCRIQKRYLYFDYTMRIVDAAGQAVWGPPGPHNPGAAPIDEPIDLASSASYAVKTYEWDERRCDDSCMSQGPSGGRAAPGHYRATSGSMPSPEPEAQSDPIELR
jgi:hypothetical protein